MLLNNKNSRAVFIIITVFGFLLMFFLIGFIRLNKAFSEELFKKIYEAFVSTENGKVQLVGDLSGGQFGAYSATGDFNADNIDDLFISSPFASAKDRTWNGAVRVIFGADAKEDVYFLGKDSGDQLGTSITTGDYNNDGATDIAISAYKAFTDSTARPGEVYIIHGGERWNNQLDSQGIDFALQEPDTTLSQGLNGAGFGLAMKTLDINNDDVDDLLIGAPFSNTPYISKSGVVYGYFGANGKLKKNYDIIFHGREKGSRFGASIGGGYINDDESTDVIIGAYLASNEDLKEAGKVYFYDGLTDVKPVNNTPTKTFLGKKNRGWFGFALDTGDINGDSYEEMAISYFPYKGDEKEAGVLIFNGGKSLNIDVPNIIIDDSLGETLIGASVLLEDLNNDAKSEIIIGAPGVSLLNNAPAGDVYIIYSDSKQQKSIIHGENFDDWFGYSLAVTDYNRDGVRDLVVGSRYSDANDSVNDGKVFILLGKNSPYGNPKAIFNQQDREVSRGEFVKIVLESFGVKENKAEVIENCYEYRDFCLFNFMSMSFFDGITLEPDIILYPDVSKDNLYYEDITAATILGLVNGYINEVDSPFRPNDPISRIGALKVIFGAADLVPPKYQFELVAMLGAENSLTSQKSYFSDVDSKISYMWWYPRYVNFAVENDIVDEGEYFRPNDNISIEELDDIINKTLEFIAAGK